MKVSELVAILNRTAQLVGDVEVKTLTSNMFLPPILTDPKIRLEAEIESVELTVGSVYPPTTTHYKVVIE